MTTHSSVFFIALFLISFTPLYSHQAIPSKLELYKYYCDDHLLKIDIEQWIVHIVTLLYITLYVYRQLEEGASGNVVEAHNQQLQTQINKLKHVLQVRNEKFDNS